MSVAFYMDVHVPGPITEQLRRRGVDVLTAQEDGCETVTDEALLLRATELGRVVFTHDVRFRVLAEDWQRQGRTFSGLLFGPQLGATFGQYVNDLSLIAQASVAEEWRGVVQFLPFAS
ncbi:MAG TPA: DUF5615 family PIN-like protein [Lacipirellula sp.]